MAKDSTITTPNVFNALANCNGSLSPVTQHHNFQIPPFQISEVTAVSFEE